MEILKMKVINTPAPQYFLTVYAVTIGNQTYSTKFNDLGIIVPNFMRIGEKLRKFCGRYSIIMI